MVGRLAPVLVLLDLELGPKLGSGADLIRPLIEAGGQVVMMTGVVERERLAACVEAGAIGIVSKTAGFPVLVDAVRRAADGESLITEGQRQDFLQRPAHPAPGRPRPLGAVRAAQPPGAGGPVRPGGGRLGRGHRRLLVRVAGHRPQPDPGHPPQARRDVAAGGGGPGPPRRLVTAPSLNPLPGRAARIINPGDERAPVGADPFLRTGSAPRRPPLEGTKKSCAPQASPRRSSCPSAPSARPPASPAWAHSPPSPPPRRRPRT